MTILGSTRVDLVLLDIEMPGMSGFETLDLIRKNPDAQNVPVIFVTSHVSTELIAQALKRGAKDYIMKPFDPEVLLKKAYAAINGVNVKSVYITKDNRYVILPEKDESADVAVGGF
jgi:putative two-component system response regulator